MSNEEDLKKSEFRAKLFPTLVDAELHMLEMAGPEPGEVTYLVRATEVEALIGSLVAEVRTLRHMLKLRPVL